MAAMEGQEQPSLNNDLSAAHIWHIAGYGPDNCETGSSISTVIDQNISKQQFVVLSSTWPYDPKNPKLSLSQIPGNLNPMVDGVAYIQKTFSIGPKDISGIKNSLANPQLPMPAVISVPVYWDSGWMTDGDIHSPAANSTLAGYHAIAILSYDDGLQQFGFINSWGQGWGKSGHGTLSYAFVQNYSQGGRAVGQLKYNANPPKGPQAYMCAVRADAGYLYTIDNGLAINQQPGCGWNGCAAYGYLQSGQDFQSNGFYLCARPDLITKRFYVGNVVNNVGYYYELQNGAVVNKNMASWNYCETGSLIGTYFDQNGFWICLEP